MSVTSSTAGLVTRTFKWADAFSWFVVAGVYASVAGLTLAGAACAAAVTAAGAWWLRKRFRLSTDTGTDSGSRTLALALLATVVAAFVLPNDVNNTDIAKQVASIEHARYYGTLLTPGFFSDQGTKYDGWTFAHAAVSMATGVEPYLLVRYSKLVLLPLFVIALYSIVRLLNLRPIHLVPAILLSLIFSGDSFRLISLGGPRSWAYAFQVVGLANLLAALKFRDQPLYAWRSSVFLGVSSLMHLFFAVTNTLIVGLVAMVLLVSRDRRGAVAAVMLASVFAVMAGPYAFLKRGSIPDTVLQPALSVPVVEDGNAGSAGEHPTRLTLRDVTALRWGEYGSLLPLLAAPLLWIGRRRPREEMLLYSILFAAPCLALLVPPVYRAAIGLLTEDRVYRLVPLSPAFTAVVVYAATIAIAQSATRSGRAIAVAALAAWVVVLAPSAAAAWEWYRMVYPSTVAERTDDHGYISVGSLLRLGTQDWPPVLATSSRLAMKLAAVTNRPIAFYQKGRRHWATRNRNNQDADQGPIAYEFVVASGGDSFPVFASCSRELYSDDGITLCATRYGRFMWSTPGTYR